MSGSYFAESSLAETLIAAANPNGGWGYYKGKTSRIEPTCWNLLALAGADRRELERHRQFLLACQRPSGLLLEDPALPANFAFNALAAITMVRDRTGFGEAPMRRLLEALARHKGQSAGPSPDFKQNNALQGWPWIDGTFSWVEPTSWALLALKLARRDGLEPPGASDRIGEAQQLLIDRCCRDGGWNYGNANVFGKDLRPHVPPTAVALLAMQDLPDAPAVSKSVAYLESRWATESSTIGLGLTAICLRQFARPIGAILDTLTARLALARDLGNLHALAVGHFASLPAAQASAFVI